MRILLSFFATIFIIGTSFAQNSSHYIRLNQEGFLPYNQKIAAIVNSEATEFKILDENKNPVFVGKLSEAKYWDLSGENVKIADFSTFTRPGFYTLYIPKHGESYYFRIRKDAFYSINKDITKAFYFNRASTELLPKHAGKYARKAGHPDTVVYIHPSAEGPKRKAGDVISTPKGWYDAGDYNKYIVNSGITTSTLLLAYENYASYFDTLNLNIPESNGKLPDLLAEIKWNLDWMLSMQDPDDGGVYFKATSARFCGMIMPHENVTDRYVVTKSTTSALNFVATTALASRIYKKFDKEYAAKCLKAAEYAWEWYLQNKNISYSHPEAQDGFPKVVTGGYFDSHFNDERLWAASELLISTQNAKYAEYIDLNQDFSTPSWHGVATMSLYSLSNNRKSVSKHIDSTQIKTLILNQANNLHERYANQNPYKVPAYDFPWGSNGVMANQGIILLYAYKITHKLHYYNAALSCYDYILGRNATEFCFITERGDKGVRNVHHRPSEGDSLDGSIPGFLAGGPNGGHKRDCFGNYSQFAAKAYLDGTCSFTTNEIAINWQAPMTYLAHGLVADYINWTKSLNKTYTFTHSPFLIFEKEKSEKTISVLSNTKWSIRKNEKWFTVSADTTQGNSFVHIKTIEVNNGDSLRTGSFNIISNGKIVQTVQINQKGKYKNFRIEAEDFDSMKGVQTEKCTDKGGGLNIGWINNGDFMTYTINIPANGQYKLKYRTSSQYNSGEINLLLNGEVISSVTTNPTGGWQEWETITDNCKLKEGKQTFIVKAVQGGFNLNYIDFEFIE